MKKFILGFILLFSLGETIQAQDIDKLMTEFSAEEGVIHQIIDRSMLDMIVATSTAMDSTNEESPQMPDFMNKLELIEIITASDAEPEIKDKVTNQLNNFKDGNGYKTLLQVNDDGDNVRIVAQQEGNKITAVFIFVIDDEDLVLMKMKGILDESDLTYIINEQKNYNNRQSLEDSEYIIEEQQIEND